MKRLFNLIAVFVLSIIPLSLMATPLLAQAEEDTMLDTSYEDYDWESYVPDDYEYDYNYDFDSSNISEEGIAALGALGILFGGVMLFIALGTSFVLYIYSSFALMTIARKLEMENAWFAWIPILNLALLLKMGMQNPWLVLLILIPGIGAFILAVLSVIAIMKVCEKRGYDKLFGLLSLVPVANLILLGVLAWGKK